MNGRAALLALLASCAPERALLQETGGKPQVEQHEIMPVGGYELMAGVWRTTQRGSVKGQRERRLMIEVDVDVLTGSWPEHDLRMRCQADHRTCTGEWSDNFGRGQLTWIFATDFKSFDGSYRGVANDAEVRGAWVGNKE